MSKKKKILIVLQIVILLIIAVICFIAFTREGKTIMKQFSQNDKVPSSNEGVQLIAQTGKLAWDTTRVKAVTLEDGQTVPVPIGYVASNVTGEKSVKTGFVIYEGEKNVDDSNWKTESKIRNQWVWVPVSNPSRIYEKNRTTGKIKSKLYEGTSSYYNDNYEPALLSGCDDERYFIENGLQGMTRERLLEELEIELEETIASIEKYGGFYIGRYETGNLSKDVPVVQRMNEDINYQSWYTMYPAMQKMGANEYVRSNMIYGCLWDETLQWLIDSKSKTLSEIKTDSSSWGNYSSSTFEYETMSGETAIKEKVSSTVGIPTGSATYTKANNIYDMAGNLPECTLECYVFNSNYYRRTRGGNCWNVGRSSSGYSSYSRTNSNPYTGGNYGFRAYLYIK